MFVDGMTILDLIPFGKEHAIPRKTLTRNCEVWGLIPEDTKDKDRYMRRLLENAKQAAVIIYREDGGYFRPTLDDVDDLRRYIKQEESKAMKIFLSLNAAKGLYEDIVRGRIKQNG